MRSITHKSIYRAAERMIRNVGWRYDCFDFEIGDRVMTRRRHLYEHLDTRVYIIVK